MPLVKESDLSLKKQTIQYCCSYVLSNCLQIPNILYDWPIKYYCGTFLLYPPQNCGWAFRFALLRRYVRTSIHTSWNLVCATPPTPLDGFCSYSYTVTNMKMILILWCCKFYMSYGTLSVYLKIHHYQHSIRWCVFMWENFKWILYMIA